MNTRKFIKMDNQPLKVLETFCFKKGCSRNSFEFFGKYLTLKTGLIMVANRSNNRIEVFDKDGRFQFNFGKGGKLQGEFERPASLACDSMNRVIVTDKDNHRIQVSISVSCLLVYRNELTIICFFLY